MHGLSYCSRVGLNDGVKELDKVARNLSKVFKNFTRFLVILCWYVLFNILLAIVYKHPKSISLETFRFINEGIRQVASQDLFIFISFYYQGKFNCLLLAVAFFTSVSFFVQFLYAGCNEYVEKSVLRVNYDEEQNSIATANVFSYKQHVAFLA